MSPATYKLWENGAPGAQTEFPQITYYKPLRKATDAAVIIFPGGGYVSRAAHEGEGYAHVLNSYGISAFVVSYRVAPIHFPYPLLDARRAVRFVRANAQKFGIDATKVAVMGSSAGGHLAALLSTYKHAIDGEGIDEIDAAEYIPNAQILCYPVVSSDESISHKGSYQNLLGERYNEREKFSPELIADGESPQAFIWHTADDGTVNVENSYRYAAALRRSGVPCELHVFPNGPHGLGTATERPHVAQWTGLLKNWLMYIGYIKFEK
jgi:acetyl esterase/lipase